MTIFSGSRYEQSTVDYFTKVPDGQPTAIVFYTPDSLTGVKYTHHTFVEGDTLISMSWRYYGRPDLWWGFLEYNPEIQDPFNIPPGFILRVPNV